MNILFVVSRVPYPLEKGDKLRAFHHLRLLAASHSVTLVALSDQPVHPAAFTVLQAYCRQIHVIPLSWASRLWNIASAFFSGLPLSCGYFKNSAAKKIVDRVISESRPDHIYCQLTRMCGYVVDRQGIPKTLDYQDAFAKGIERRIAREPWWLRWILRLEHRRLAKYEAEVLESFDNCVIISAQDRDYIEHVNRDRIVVVPNGIDLEYFMPQSVEKDFDLVFAGNMAYPPNVESVLFLVNKVLPIVWRTRPEVRLLIAGATPSSRVLALEGRNVHVSGWVDDIRQSYARANVFVAPMQISTGLQNKLLEAMAMRLPCIASEMANNALGGVHGENILVCSTPEEYASAIVRLLEHPDEADRLAEAGYHSCEGTMAGRNQRSRLSD